MLDVKRPYGLQSSTKVTIIEALGNLMSAGRPVPHPNKIMLIDLLKFHKVDVITDTCLLEIKEDSIVTMNKDFGKIQ